MQTKPFYLSKTFYAVLATAIVLLAKEALPQYSTQLGYAQGVLTVLGLWFARLGAGTPIAGKE